MEVDSVFIDESNFLYLFLLDDSVKISKLLKYTEILILRSVISINAVSTVL